ncbi:MAG: hypothetical protein EAZ21_10870, partial [Betaproteobacteria bacterium]
MATVRFGGAVKTFFNRAFRCVLPVIGLAAFDVSAQVCGVPGSSGTGTISGIVNTYYEPTGNSAQGTSAVTINTAAASIRGAGATPTVGALVLIVQMQGATIDFNNDTRYGDGAGTAAEITGTSAATGAQVARGVTGTPLAGTYEFARVSAYNGTTGVISLANALTNSYQRSDPTATVGRYRYQVVLVPQYASATIASATPVTGATWNGETGGVVAIDVSGLTTFTGTGTHINASAIGFRGGYGDNGGTVDGSTQYVAAAGAIGSTTDTTKGEGIAGTPRHVWDGTASVVVSATQGYPGGDYGRGAPGNAGGGGIGHNSGGGGGANGGIGGRGGATYSGETGTTFIVSAANGGVGNSRDVGGFGGAPFTTAGRMIMGGGGGAGDANGGGLEPAEEGPGGVGGGIIFFSSGSVAAGQNGNFVANGGNGVDADAEGTGGGGAGGSVILRVGTAAHTARINATALGGNGGNFNFNGTNTTGHCGSAGGGGSGGVIRYLGATAPASALLTGGTRGNHIDGGACLGTNGDGGLSAVLTSQPPGNPGFDCLPVVSVAKSDPAIVTVAGNQLRATYTVTVQNTGGSAGTYTLSDTPAFPTTGIALNSINATTVGGALAAPAFPRANPTNNTAQQISTTALAIAAGATHTYTIEITFTVAGNATNLTCSGATPNNGAFNTAAITGSSTSSDPGCSDIPAQLPSLQLAKTSSSATFSVGVAASYTLTLTNTGTAATTAV